MQQLSQLDYEAIENAVMETARGRWFLSEYKKRHAGTNTSSLLDAISRLEKVVTTLGDGTYQPAKADNTVAATPEIAETAPMISETPKAKESAKKFVAPTPFFSGSKDSKKDATSEPTPLNDENLKFFSNDEDLFSDDANDLLPDASSQNIENPDLASAQTESAQDESPKIDLSFSDTKVEAEKPAESTLDAEATEVSDRFKIFRTDTSAQEESQETASTETELDAKDSAHDAAQIAAVEPALDALFGDSAPALEQVSEPALETQETQDPVLADPVVAAPVVNDLVISDPVVSDPVVPDPAIQATDEEKDRIVIIRGNSDNNMDIPFGDDIFGDKSDKPVAS